MAERREELTLVTNFQKLKAGDVVVVKPCAWCGSSHRKMLTRSRTESTVGPEGDTGIDLGWDTVPLPPCIDPRVPGLLLTRTSVEERRVYLVGTGLEQASDDHAEMPKLKRVTL